MKPTLKIFPLLAMIILITGCARGWTWVDGSPVDSRSLQNAEAACQIEQKKAQLEQAEDQFDYQMSQAETDAAEKEIQDNFDRIERRINTEIRTCMRKMGLAPSR